MFGNDVISEERARIARELHDVVAHHLSVIVVQARVLAEAMPADEPSCVSAQAIVDSGRRGLDEMRRIVHVLRAGEEADRRWPAGQPLLADLDGLFQAVERTGLLVKLEVEGDERPLPETLHATVYRLVQEALTNVLRHARAGTAKVRLAYTPTALELQVTDDGRPLACDQADGEGHGLIGMRERVRMFGGEISCGPAVSEGYVVQAVLPL